MSDNKVDSILLEIDATTNKAEGGIGKVINNLKALKEVTEGIDVQRLKTACECFKCFATTGEGLKQAGNGMKSITSSIRSMENINSTKLKDIADVVNKIGIGLGNLGSNNKISIRIDSDTIKKSVKPLEQVQKTKDAIDAAAKDEVPELRVRLNAEGAQETLKDFTDQLRRYSSMIDEGGFESANGMTFPTSGLQLSLEKLKAMHPQAKELIDSYETEIKRLDSIEFKNSSIKNNSDTQFSGIDLSAIEKIESKSKEASDKLKDLGEKLNQLVVPEIRVDDLTKLQKMLEKTESDLDKLRVKLENGVTMGKFSESADDKTFRGIQEQIAFLEKQSTALKQKITSVSESTNKSTAEVAESFRRNFGKLKVPAIRTNNLKQLEKDLQHAEMKLDRLRVNLANDITMGRVKADFRDGNYAKQKEQIAYEVKRIESIKEKIKGVGAQKDKLTGISDIFTKIGNAAGGVARTGINSFNKALRGVTGAVKTAANSVKSLQSKLNSAAKGMIKLATSAQNSHGMIKKLTKSIKSMDSSLENLPRKLRSVTRLFTFMLLRKTITALFEDLGGAFQHLALKSDTVNVHISALISSCKNFSHSVAALAMPLLSIFGPALTQVIDLLSKATAYMNQFLSALTGKSYYIASIKQNYDYAESLKEIEKAAKKLNTIGIDEFNIISPDDKDLDDLEDCYEQLEIAPDIAEWAQKIKDAFLEQDWEGIGKQIADLMNSGLGKLYDKLIDITPKVEQALKNFSTAFNSWVENFDWDLLGRTIGAGVNLLVKSFNALTGDDGIDFENLGSKLSVGFRGMINEIEWDELGNALGNGFMISWRIADGFIQDMWRIDPNTLLNGWQELGIAIGEMVNGVFERIDFEQIARVLTNGFRGVLETLATALNTIDFASIVKKINAGLEALYSGLKWENGMGEQITKFTEALSNAFNDLLDINFGMVGSIIGAGITDIVRAFNQLVENIDFERLGQNLADGIRSLFAEIEWDELGNALGNGFMVAWRILGGFIKEMSKEKNAGLNGWEELGTAIGEAISSLFEKIDWNTISLCISGLVNGISDLLFKSFSGIDWKDLGTKIGQFIKKTLEDIDFKDLGRTLGTVFQSAVDFLKSIVSQISLKDVTDAFIDLFKGFFEKANWEDVAPAILLGFGSFATDILPKSLSKYLTIAKVAALALAFIYIFADSFKEVDWSVVGEGISESINNFLSNIDGARLAKGATDLTNGLMEALSSCVRSIDWSQLWGIIIDFLTNINYLDGLMLPLKFFKISADLIAGLVIGLIEAIFETDWGEVWDNILATFKEFFGIHSPSTVMEEQGGFLIRGLINGIFAFIGSVREAFRELVGEVKKALEEKWNEVVEWWNNTTLVKWWNDSVAPWFTKEKWSELYSSIKTGLEEKWSELQTWWEGTGFSQWIEENIKPWFTKEKWLEIYDSVKTGLQGKWEELKAWWDNTSFSEWIDSNVKPWFTKEKWLEIYDNFKKSFTEKWEELKKWWKDTGFSD